MAIRAVIFDMDGVLVDSYQSHFQSWLLLGQDHGVEMTEQQFADTFGRTSREIIPLLWPQIPAQDIPAMDAQKEAYYRQVILANFPEMDGAGELISQLAGEGFAMAIGSSGPRENVEAVLACLTNANLITASVNANDVDRGKPDPQVFLLAAEKLRVAPANCAVIEDAPVGLEAARRAGMAAVGITGTAPRDALTEKTTVVVDSLREISPTMISELIARNGGQA